MKIFEILFILLLLIPIALLMRFLVSKLSKETPKQRGGAHGADEDKPSIRAWLARKNQEMEEDEEFDEEIPPMKAAEPARSTAGYGQDRSSYAGRPQESSDRSTSYAERSRTQLKRTERIPFSEIYGYEQPELQPQKQEPVQMDAAGRVEARRASAAKKKPARSEQAPSKRQKRKNRARARKRQASRRNKQE